MDQEERADLVAMLFALMTSKLEDAAHEAMEGQRKGLEESDQIARAERIEMASRDIGLLAEAVAAILRSQLAG